MLAVIADEVLGREDYKNWLLQGKRQIDEQWKEVEEEEKEEEEDEEEEDEGGFDDRESIVNRGGCRGWMSSALRLTLAIMAQEEEEEECRRRRRRRRRRKVYSKLTQ